MTFETIIEVRKDWIDRLESLCQAVKEKDETFRYRWRKDPQSGAKAVVVKSENKKQAHRRGVFLKKCISDPEMFDKNVSYVIREVKE